MTVLSVNFNKICLLRNSRGRDFPKLSDFAEKALKLGAGGLTLHPRQDQRHARYADLPEMKKLVSQYPGTELNIEGYPGEEFIQHVLAVKPHQCTLVPDAPEAITSDHGWNLPSQTQFLVHVIAELKQAGIRVSLFMDPIPEQIKTVPETGADRIELYTESYAHAFETQSDELEQIWQQFTESAKVAKQLGLGVNAGHDLSLENLPKFLSMGMIEEVSIGHALMVESLWRGYEPVIQAYLKICQANR